MRTVQNQKELKLNNLTKILDFLKKNDVVVKSTLARELGLSVVTISKICDDLADAGIVEYTTERESTGGRKPLGIRLVRDSRYIIALDLSEKEQAYTGILDLNYREIAGTRFEIPGTWGISDFLTALQSHLEPLRRDIPEEKIMGMCVSIPAIFNPGNGIIEECNNPLFINQNMIQRISTVFPGKIIMENDANLAALGHFHQNRVENLLYIHFTEGIGLGIILNGEIYRGHAGYAGELAYMGVPDFEGNWCTVEKALSEQYLVRCLESLTGRPEGTLSPEDFEKEIIRESGEIVPITDYIKTTIGRVTAVLIDLFNPEQVILGGRNFVNFKSFLPEIIGAAQEYSMTSKRIAVEIKEASDDQNLVIKGCCERFYQDWIRTAPIIT